MITKPLTPERIAEIRSLVTSGERWRTGLELAIADLLADREQLEQEAAMFRWLEERVWTAYVQAFLAARFVIKDIVPDYRESFRDAVKREMEKSNGK